ncbi:hypothetical protein JCM11957_04690 [Caminibacter profundus]
MKNRISLIKIVDFIFIALFLFFVWYVIIDIKNISLTLRETQKEKVLIALKAQNDVFAPLLKFEFFDQLKANIKNFVDSSKEIKQVEIISKNFKFIYPEKEVQEKVIVFPIKYNSQEIGKIKVIYSDKELINTFFKKYFSKFSFYVLILIIFIIIALLYIRKKIEKLHLFAREIEKIDFRKVSYLPYLDSYYEIVNITNAINKLLTQVNSFYTSQRNMFKKIIKYKKQLETGQKISHMFSWEFDCDKKEFVSNVKIENFLNIPGIKKMKDFIDHLENEDKVVFFNHFNMACKKCDTFEMIQKLISSNNKVYYIKTQGKCIKSKDKKTIIGVSLDITEEIKKQEKIEFLAYHDTLTTLPNRVYLKEHLSMLAKLANRNNEKFAILYLDLDNFKMVNDTFGHESGDKLLIEVSKKIKEILRESDILSRIGGDEFIIVLYDISSKKVVEKVVDKIKKVLQEPFYIKDSKIYVTFSIGGAIFPDDSKNIDELLQYADIAMYESKNNGKNTFTFISDKLKYYINDYYQIVTDLKDALKKDDEIVLYFQPKIDIVNKKVQGAEGLIRWNHPKRGLLTPFHFISYAEKSGLISQIDRYVIKKAIETLKNWEKDELLKDMHLAVNISANEFRQQDFVSNLRKLVDEYKIDPSKLEIEITETLSMQNFAYAVGVLEEVKRLGVKIALDDFGTGYSSLNYLKKLPFDILKIDQTFIRDLEKDNDDLLITKMIIEISKILNKVNVAEGVENKELLKIVSELGCQYVQGYYFAKPLENKEFFEYVKNFDFEKIQ